MTKIPQHCPIRNGGLTTSPDSVRGLELIEFLPDEHGGSGTRVMRCLHCGKGFFVTEDHGGHFPQYSWPQNCPGEELPQVNLPGPSRDSET